MKLKWLLIAVVCLIYLAARLWNLTASCLWFDEIFSIHAAQHSWSELPVFVAQDLIHPPLFYIILKIWMTIGGESFLWLRLFSVAMAAAAIFPVAMLCRELKLSLYGIAGVILLLGINGSLIKYAQEVRMYSLLFCLTAFSIWLFVRWMKKENASLAVLFIINLLLIYTHYFGWLVVASELLIVLWMGKERLKFTAYAALLGLSFIPWAYAVFSAYRQNAGLEQNLNWAEKPDLRSLGEFFATMQQSFYFQQISIEPVFLNAAIALALVLGGAVVYLFVVEKEQKDVIKMLLAFVLLPLLTAFFVSLVSPFSIWGTRHLIVIFLPYFILAVMGLSKLKPRMLQAAGAVIIAVVSALTFSAQYARPQAVYSWCGWQPLAEKLERADAQTIYVFEDASAYELWFALAREGKSNYKVVLIEDYANIAEDKAYFLPRGFDGVTKASENSISGDRFLIAVRAIGENDQHPLWRDLKTKGYRMGAPVKFDAQDIDIFFVPVFKDN